MSHWHTGYLAGADDERGIPLDYDPALVEDAGYRHGFDAGRAAVVKSYERAVAAGLVAVVSRVTGAVHYAVEDPADDSPMCGQGQERNGIDVDRVGKPANCYACIVKSAEWVVATRAELTAR